MKVLTGEGVIRLEGSSGSNLSISEHQGFSGLKLHAENTCWLEKSNVHDLLIFLSDWLEKH